MFQKIFSIFLIFILTFSNSFADLENSLTFKENFEKKFEIKNTFQNPTYLLEKELEKDKYTCENETDCRVNFDFRSSFNDEFKVKEFSCLFEFGEEKQETCNPNTISIEKEETEFKIKIFLKKDENIFKERIIKIIKKKEDSETSSGGQENGIVSEENTGTGKTEDSKSDLEGKNENAEKENFEKKIEIKNTFQNPTYLLEKEIEKDEYICENEDDCRVNFDFRTSFNDNFKVKEFSCLFEYGEEKQETCNPSTISIEKEETEFKIKIFLKKDENIFKERVIKILKPSSLTSLPKGENDSKDSGTGKSEDNGNNEEKENFEKNFEIKNIFQNPTYLLEKEIEKDEYICENEDDCRINFDFRTSFNDNFKVKEFSCLFEYGEEKQETCNPNTILIEKEETEFKIKIFLKKDENVFKERIIKIIKKKEDSETSSGGQENGIVSEENTGTGKTEDSKSDLEGKKENTEKENFEKNFEIKNIFQNPTTLYYKEAEKEEYFCNKKDCKVNFDFRFSFNDDFKAKEFSCEVDFLGEKIKTCNPSTFDILEGDTEIFIKIFHKKNKNIFKIKKYIIKNEKNISTSSSYYKIEKKIDNREKNIIENTFVKIKIQSGLKDGKCEKKDCKVNFSFENKNKNLSCLWDFGSKIEFKKGTDEKCNPSSIIFPPGKHIVILKVFEKNNPEKFKQDFFEFENIFKEEDLNAKIVLTGVSEKFQKSKNSAICSGKSNCNLNFGLENISKNAKKFIWDFGNGEIFEGKNPKSVKFLEGNFVVSLKIFDEENNFKELFFYVLVKKEKELNFFEKLFIFAENKEKIFDVKVRKNQNNLNIFSETNEKILLEKSFNFPVLGKFIYFKEYEFFPDEFGKINEKIDYERIGDFDFNFYKIGEDEELFFSELKNVEISYKNYILSEILEIEKEEKEKQKDLKKEEKALKKVKKKKEEEEKFLKIILQGKSTKNKKLYEKEVVCNGDCSVNFGLETNIKGKNTKKIFWDLGNSVKFEGKNPKSQKYKPGIYKIFVKYLDENGKELTDSFTVKVNKKLKKIKKKKKKKGKLKIGPVKLVIKVQGRIGKNKILTENKLICAKTCSVNFDGRDSLGAYKELIWNFGNGEKFVGENPKSVKYKEFGKYQVSLKTYDFKGNLYEKKFEVEFVENLKNKENFEKIDKNNLEKKEFKKEDFIFIFVIMFLIFSGSIILFKKYKIF